MLQGLPLSLETGLVGLVVAVIGSVISLVVSGQALTWPVIVSAVIAAGMNYFTSSQRPAEVPGQPSQPNTPQTPSGPTTPQTPSGQSW